jgi:lipoate-protein ligase A
MNDAPLRIIDDDGRREPRYNLAVDEALARSVGTAPTLRFWRNDRCVILGRFQVAEAEVDLVAAHRLGVPVYRRFTGGGAVYHDDGNLNVSLVAPRDHPLVGRRSDAGLQALHGVVLEPLAVAVRTLGIPAGAATRGLFVGDRKLGGVAAWVGGRAVLVHATLLVDADLEALERVLAGPGAPGNARWRLTKSERAPVTSLARELDRATAPGAPSARSDLRAIEDVVAAAFRAAAGDPAERPVLRDGLQAAELAVAADLFWSRYGNDVWHASG